MHQPMRSVRHATARKHIRALLSYEYTENKLHDGLHSTFTNPRVCNGGSVEITFVRSRAAFSLHLCTCEGHSQRLHEGNLHPSCAYRCRRCSLSTSTLSSTCSCRLGHSSGDSSGCFDKSSVPAGFLQQTCTDNTVPRSQQTG